MDTQNLLFRHEYLAKGKCGFDKWEQSPKCLQNKCWISDPNGVQKLEKQRIELAGSTQAEPRPALVDKAIIKLKGRFLFRIFWNKGKQFFEKKNIILEKNF